jgi:hypothetical protein
MSLLPPGGDPGPDAPLAAFDSLPAPVVGAELTLALAARRLDAMRWAALFGGDYDPDSYDSAVVEYRRARAGAVAVRRPLRSGTPPFAPAA